MKTFKRRLISTDFQTGKRTLRTARDGSGTGTPPPPVKLSPPLPAGHERLLGELEALLLGEGFLHLQTRELAARLHCSKQTLYRLAPSRMQLFELVARRVFDRICREADEAAAQANDWRSAVIAHLDAAVFATQGVAPQFTYDLYAFPAVVENYRKRRVDGFAAIIREGTKARIIKNIHPRLAAEALLRAVTILHDSSFILGQRLTPAQSHSQLHRLLLDGLLEARTRARRPGSAATQRSNARPTRVRRQRPQEPRRVPAETYLI